MLQSLPSNYFKNLSLDYRARRRPELAFKEIEWILAIASLRNEIFWMISSKRNLSYLFCKLTIDIYQFFRVVTRYRKSDKHDGLSCFSFQYICTWCMWIQISQKMSSKNWVVHPVFPPEKFPLLSKALNRETSGEIACLQLYPLSIEFEWAIVEQT